MKKLINSLLLTITLIVPLTLMARDFNATEEIRLLPGGGGAVHFEGDVNRLKVNGGVLQISNDSGGTYRDVFQEPSAANGQILIGNGTGIEVGDLSGTANQISVGSGSGSLSLSTPQDLDTAADFQVGSLGIGGAAGADAVLDAQSTTKGSRACPVMTTAQRDAIVGPAAGLCVYNSTTGKMNVYSGSAWSALGGGVDAWVTAFPYVIGDVVHESNKIYLALTNHTSGTFATDLGNNEWVELSATTNVDLTADVINTLPIANGGTNSSTALGNGKIMISVGGAIVEATDLQYVDATDVLTLNGQLNVDNLRIDGNTLSATSGDIVLQPAAVADVVDLTLAGISYEVGSTGTGRLQIENTDVANPDMIFELFSQDSDLTSDSFFRAFGSGGPAAANADALDVGFDQADDNYGVMSKGFGTNAARALKLQVGANEDQLLLDTSGNVTASAGDINIAAEGELRLQDGSGGQYMGFKAPTTLTASQTFTLPDGDGSANQVLKTDGNGTLYWDGSNTSPVSNWQSCTVGGSSWTTNTTISCLEQRVGDSKRYKFYVQTSGAPDAANLTIDLPAGDVIDVANKTFFNSSGGDFVAGTLSVLDAGTDTFFGRVGWVDSNTLNMVIHVDQSTVESDAAITNLQPMTFANGDTVLIETIPLPIVGLSSTTDILTQQAFSPASIKWTNLIGCAPAITAATFTNFNDTDCTFAAAQTIGSVVTPSTAGDIALKMPSVPPGKYLVSLATYGFAGTGTQCSFRLSDGTKHVGPTEYVDQYFAGGFSGIVEYTSTQTNLEWVAQADRVSGASNCSLGAQTDNTSIQISFVPVAGVMTADLDPKISSQRNVNAADIPTGVNRFLDFPTAEEAGNFTGCGAGHATSSGTGCRYVAAKAGWHDVSTQVIVNDTDWDDNETIVYQVRVNDVSKCHTREVGLVSSATNVDLPLAINCKVKLQVNDIVEVRMDHSAGADLNLITGDEFSWFQVREY